MEKPDLIEAITQAESRAELELIRAEVRRNHRSDSELDAHIRVKWTQLVDSSRAIAVPAAPRARIDDLQSLANEAADELEADRAESKGSSALAEEAPYVPSPRKVAEVKAVAAAMSLTPSPALTLAQRQELRKELMTKIAASTDADALTTMLVPELDLATRADDLKPLRAAVKGTVQAKLKELNGVKPTAADMHELFPTVVKKLKPTYFAMTHYGVAQRVTAETNGDLRYNIDEEQWLLWNGCRWLILRSAQVAAIARNAANQLKAEAALLPGVEAEKLDHVDSDSFRRGIVGEMLATERMHVEQLDLDQHPRYLASGNGAIDLHTGQLVCERDLLITVKNDTEFDSEAEAPLFLKLLDEVFEGRAPDIKYYELIMGYTLQANPSERAMFFHKGEGTNGKSLLLGAIMKTLGDYAVATSYKLIADGPGATMNGSADGPSPSLRRLMSKRMAYIDEIPVGSNLRDADVKRLAGGAGIIDARALGKETVEFPITFVFHIACNNMATVRNGQPATFKRTYPVVYTKQFDAVEDSTLAEKLDDEREGILAWLVRCSTKYHEMRARGESLRDHMPQTAKDALEGIKSEQNPFTAWIAEHCVIEEGAFLSVKDGYNDFIAHHDSVSKDKGKVRSERAFVQLMNAFKVAEHKTQYGPGRLAGFLGLRLKADVALDLALRRAVDAKREQERLA